METPLESAVQAGKGRPLPLGPDRQALDRLSRSLADQFAALYDIGPADPRVSREGSILTFAFAGGLSASDELLLEVGRGEQLREFREHFLRAISGQLSEVVEALTGAAVRHFFPAFELPTRTTSCFFVLDEHVRDEAEQRRALLNWSEQVRRNARDLRQRHRAAREAHARLRDVLHDVRVDSGENAG